MARIGTDNPQLVVREEQVENKKDLYRLIQNLMYSIRSAFNDHSKELNLLDSEAFSTPTLLNSWVNEGSAGNSTAGYYKDTLNHVHIRGTIKDGTTTSGTNLFLLPSGYRPATRERFFADANGAYGLITVETDGNVKAQTVSATLTSLDNIHFRIA